MGNGHYINIEKTGRPLYGDHILIASIILLTGLGFVTLYSSSFAYSERFFKDGLYLFSHQLIMGGGGIVLFILASRIKLELVRNLTKFMVIITIVLCFLTFVPGIGVMKNGAARWIKIGSYTYQPSELVKLVLPLYLAHILDKKQANLDSFFSGILPPVIVTVLFFVLIYMQNNFSTAVLLALNALVVFYFAGVRLRFFFSALLMFLPLSGILILTKEHRLRRVFSFIFPDWEPQGAGFQVRASLLTIISGGFLGKGIGHGTRKIASVPEIHSDFIFSSFAEESGFLGVLLFCLLFAVFAVQGYKAALRKEDMYRRLVAAGIVTSILSQVLLNIAVVAGILPTTGIPLPFFSAGGSSLATTLLSVGLVVNVSRSPRAAESLDDREIGWQGVFEQEYPLNAERSSREGARNVR
ncbi:MAG: putative lipid II flippase FtsW [Treponema sp.]|nr:putative lipid II flippase FtsW [Treponema sp.]